MEVGPERLTLTDKYVRVDYQGDGPHPSHSLGTWFKTDEEGKIRTGLHRGWYEISMDHLNVRETRELRVNSTDPVTFTLRLQ